MRVETRKYLLTALSLFFWGGCASSPDSPSSVLEPVTETESAPPAEETLVPKPSERLLEQLRALGYQGLGLEYEDPSTIALLEKVFAAPEAQGLDLRLVYTGMRMQYDATQKSVTIGGTNSVAAILAFLKKSVPKRPAGAVPPPAGATPAAPSGETKKPASIPVPLLPESSNP